MNELLNENKALHEEVISLRQQLFRCTCDNSFDNNTDADDIQNDKDISNVPPSPPRSVFQRIASRLVDKDIVDHRHHGEERMHTHTHIVQPVTALDSRSLEEAEREKKNIVVCNDISQHHDKDTNGNYTIVDLPPKTDGAFTSPSSESSNGDGDGDVQQRSNDATASDGNKAKATEKDSSSKESDSAMMKRQSSAKLLELAKHKPITTILRRVYFPSRREFDYSFERPCSYLNKIRPHISNIYGPAPVNLFLALYSTLCSFLSIAIISGIDENAESRVFNSQYSYHGATAVMLFCTPLLNTATPRNMVIGHFLSSMSAVIICNYIIPGGLIWLQSALSVAISVLLMQLTGSVNPPSAAAALLYATSPAGERQLGFLYVGNVMIGNTILLLCGLLFTNLPKSLKYPKYWL